MRTLMKITVLSAGLLAAGAVVAEEEHHRGSAAGQSGGMGMMGDPARMQKMMEERMRMMKAELKLDAEQAKAFDAFAKRKQAMMKEMMAHHKEHGHGGQGGMGKGMQGGTGKGSMGQGGMMGKMAGVPFAERMKMMEAHARKMLETAQAGQRFYNTLTPAQKKKLDAMSMQPMGKGMGKSRH